MFGREMALQVILSAAATGAGGFVDVTDDVGLGPEIVPETVSRLCFADLTGDGFPDAVINRHRVFLNTLDPDSSIGRRFSEVPPGMTGLHEPHPRSVAVFADLSNDGRLDALIAEHLRPEDPDGDETASRRTGWHPGRGDGTFDQRTALPTPPRPTVAIAVADVNRNGFLDIYLGNEYIGRGHGFEAHTNDLLLSDGRGGWQRHPLPEDDHEFTMEEDRAGRPTYGAMIVSNPVGEGAMLLELSYGRRANRAWVRDNDDDGAWRDIAPQLGLNGDEIRHGRYPQWLKERAKTDPRFDRPDEKPFRSHGNTFDAAAGDLNNNGLFDILISEITHGWAGDSSDRTRLLFAEPVDGGFPPLRYAERDGFNLDRVPPLPEDETQPHNWNHGDLFCELADVNHSGRLDVILSSGDYPDDQRLRIWLQEPDGSSLRNATAELGIDHDGSQQISLADVDGNGALDILVGQTFNRFTAEQREGRSPRIRLLSNRAAGGRESLTLRLRGDGRTINRNGLGAVVAVQIGDLAMQRQLIGIGGHAGKQHDFIVHFGLGPADGAGAVDRLTIRWPDEAATVQVFEQVRPGRYTITLGGNLKEEKDWQGIAR